MALLPRLLRPRSRLHRLLSTSRASHRSAPPSKNGLKPFYITTPIFYPNASPHIGHLYSLVTADVFARFQRLKGRDTRFLAGTDEHGMKIQKAARAYFEEKAGREQEFCDMLSERFRDLGKKASISNTCFMRTSSKEHHKAVEHVWRNLFAKGYIYKSQYEGWYSITDECFYTDSQVQDGVSLETGAAVEWTSEENYMFRLSAFRESLLQHYLSHPRSVYPPQYHENVIGMLGGAPLHFPSDTGNNGTQVSSPVDEAARIEDFVLSDISISRPRSRLEWGVQVPDDPEQTVYVWFDALLIYLTGSGYPWPASSFSSTPTYLSSIVRDVKVDVLEGMKNGWPADVQVIGKDILRFHAIYFPAILLALSGGSYTPPSSSASSSSTTQNQTNLTTNPTHDLDHDLDIPKPQEIPVSLSGTLLTHAHWTSSQKKMSKSLGNVADPLEAMDKWGVDVVRFYMMRIGGRWRTDVDWSAEQLDKHHKEIQAQLGNYFLRVSSPRLAERARSAGEGLDARSGLPLAVQCLFLDGAEETNSSTGTGDDVVVDVDVDGHEHMGIDVNALEKLNAELLRQVVLLPGKVETQLEMLEAGNALGEIMGVLKLANKTLTDIAPWAKTTPASVVHTTRLVALETLRVVGLCLTPFMPSVSERLLGALGVGQEAWKAFGSGVGKAKAKAKVDASASASASSNGSGKREMEVLWERWNSKDVRGVKLFESKYHVLDVKLKLYD